MGPKERRSSVLGKQDEALAVTSRRHTRLPLKDCLYAHQATIPHLTRSSLHRGFQRHGISRLPEVGGSKPKAAFKAYPIGHRTLKEATVSRYNYEKHDALRAHLSTFLGADNFARRLKTLRGLTPFEFIAQRWTSEPHRFRYDPDHLIPGPHI